jgi:hypothetical protein
MIHARCFGPVTPRRGDDGTMLRGTHGKRGRPKAGWSALTDTEKTVAALLA